MDDAFEAVAAENKLLRKELKTLRERVAAFESSRWWRAHPRYAVRRITARSDRSGNDDVEHTIQWDVRRVAHQRRLKVEFERRNANRKPDEIVICDGISLHVHPEPRWSFEQYCYGVPEMVDELDGFLALVPARRRLLDVGAFHGLFSLVFAAIDRTKEAVAVDPSPVAFAKLLYNIHRNRSENITALECALSSECGVLEMHYELEHAVAGRRGTGADRLRVPSDTGDSLCDKHSFAPDVIKIDVEGHELRVIQGLRETIRRNRPLIFLEVHPGMICSNPTNGHVSDLVHELVALGYPLADVRKTLVPTEDISALRDVERLLLRPE